MSTRTCSILTLAVAVLLALAVSWCRAEAGEDGGAAVAPAHPTSAEIAFASRALTSADPPDVSVNHQTDGPLLEIPLGSGQTPLRVESSSRAGTVFTLKISTAACPGLVRVEARLPGGSTVAHGEWACAPGEPGAGEVGLDVGWRNQVATLELTAWSGSESGARAGVTVHATPEGLVPGGRCGVVPVVDSATAGRIFSAVQDLAGAHQELEQAGSVASAMSAESFRSEVERAWSAARCASPPEDDGGCSYRRAPASEIRSWLSNYYIPANDPQGLDLVALRAYMLLPDVLVEETFYRVKDARRGCGGGAGS